jgi:23S rRNA (uracil1939-C5)-methyltransferase
LNRADNVQFVAGDVDEVIGSVERADVVVLDPPRRGCNPETVKRIVGLRPRRIVYVSCNPATLARDLGLFGELGYATSDVEPLDMFPQTFHVETIALLCPAES